MDGQTMNRRVKGGAGERTRRGRDAKPKGGPSVPGLAPRVVRHVERDSGRFVVWHVVDAHRRFSPGCAQL